MTDVDVDTIASGPHPNPSQEGASVLFRETDKYVLKLAETQEDRLGAERLRYRVFVEELGATGAHIDHEGRFERDALEPFFQHLILIDKARDPETLDHVVGVYRLMTQARAAEAGRFYSEGEYDLTPLKTSGRRLLELGRSCVDAEHRRGPALAMLWQGLGRYVAEHQIDVLFGVASFIGTDVSALAQPLSHLHANHLAPVELRARAVEHAFEPMDLLAPEEVIRMDAIRATPTLIKSYLRAGGFVGEGAFVDHDFGTTDVCLVLDIERMNPATRARFQGDRS